MFKKKMSEIAKLLSKNFIVILLVATVAVVLTVGYTAMRREASYTAEAEILVHNGDLGNTPQSGGDSARSFLPTCERLFNSKAIFEHLNGQFLSDKDYTAEELDKMITVKAEGRNSLFMKVTVTCSDPDEACHIINAYINALPDYMRFVSTSVVISPISVDTVAELDRPSFSLLIILSFLSGALVASLLVVIVGLSSNKLSGVEDYKARYSSRLLGTVPDFEASSKGGN